MTSWKDVDPSFPDERLQLFGPGTDSGTFDFFTEKIVGEEGASRSDYSATEDDNVIVNGVAGRKGAPRLSRPLVRRAEQRQAEGGGGRRRRRLRWADRRDRSGRHLQAALTTAARLRERRRARREAPGLGLPRLSARQPARASREGALFVPLTEEQLNRRGQCSRAPGSTPARNDSSPLLPRPFTARMPKAAPF